jgi:hypothetical protein
MLLRMIGDGRMTAQVGFSDEPILPQAEFGAVWIMVDFGAEAKRAAVGASIRMMAPDVGSLQLLMSFLGQTVGRD